MAVQATFVYLEFIKPELFVKERRSLKLNYRKIKKLPEGASLG